MRNRDKNHAALLPGVVARWRASREGGEGWVGGRASVKPDWGWILCSSSFLGPSGCSDGWGQPVRSTDMSPGLVRKRCVLFSTHSVCLGSHPSSAKNGLETKSSRCRRSRRAGRNRIAWHALSLPFLGCVCKQLAAVSDPSRWLPLCKWTQFETDFLYLGWRVLMSRVCLSSIPSFLLSTVHTSVFVRLLPTRKGFLPKTHCCSASTALK